MKISFNCSRSFWSSWVDQVTTTAWSFVSAIANIAASFAIAVDNKTQYADQVRITWTSQLIKGI